MSFSTCTPLMMVWEASDVPYLTLFAIPTIFKDHPCVSLQGASLALSRCNDAISPPYFFFIHLSILFVTFN